MKKFNEANDEDVKNVVEKPDKMVEFNNNVFYLKAYKNGTAVVIAQNVGHCYEVVDWKLINEANK